jgi:hypothetical protein
LKEINYVLGMIFWCAGRDERGTKEDINEDMNEDMNENIKA